MPSLGEIQAVLSAGTGDSPGEVGERLEVDRGWEIRVESGEGVEVVRGEGERDGTAVITLRPANGVFVI